MYKLRFKVIPYYRDNLRLSERWCKGRMCFMVDAKLRLLTTYKNSRKSHVKTFKGISASFFNISNQLNKYKPLHGINSL